MIKQRLCFIEKFFVLILLFVLGLLNAGCNPHAKEKKRLTTEMENLKIEIDQEMINLNGISSQINDYQNKIANQEEEKLSKENEKSSSQKDLVEFILDHKMATLSLIAAGGGIAATLEENLDEDTKNILQGLGVIGAIYCIFNAEECANVTTKVAWYGTEISNLNDEIASIGDKIDQLNKELYQLKEKYNICNENIEALKTQLNEKQERYDSL